MASRRLQVLAFVLDYFARYGEGPSLSEIGAAHGISKARVHELVGALVRRGQLLRRPGPRGLYPPAVRTAAVRQLRELGWAVDEDVQYAGPLTHSALPAVPALDYVPPAAAGGGDDDGGEQAEAGAGQSQ